MGRPGEENWTVWAEQATGMLGCDRAFVKPLPPGVQLMASRTPHLSAKEALCLAPLPSGS